MQKRPKAFALILKLEVLCLGANLSCKYIYAYLFMLVLKIKSNLFNVL